MTLYQDVHVEPDTWYTIRADGKRLEGDAGASIELREYNLVNGSPQFIQTSLTKRAFGATIQTRGDIVRSGKIFLVNRKKNYLINQVIAAPPDDECVRTNVGKCGPQGGCSSDFQECEETSANKFECKFEDSFCLTYFQNQGATPRPPSCETDLKGKCVLNDMCATGGVYSIPANGYSDCRDMNIYVCCVKEKVIRDNPLESWPYCSYSDFLSKPRCRKELDPIPQKCDKSTYTCGLVINADKTKTYKWNKYSEDTSCLDKEPKCTSGGSSSPPTTISIPPKPECTTDDNCTKEKPDTFCEAGVCKDRPAQCGTVCYDPAEGDISATTIEDRCKPLTCAPAQSDGKRYCWGEGCSSSGG